MCNYLCFCETTSNCGSDESEDALESRELDPDDDVLHLRGASRLNAKINEHYLTSSAVH